MNIRFLIGGSLLIFGLGWGLCSYFKPAKIVTEIKEVTKEVEVVKKDVITVIKEKKNTDGSSTKETIITDKSTIDKETQKDVQSLQMVTNNKSQYKIHILGGYDLQIKEFQYGLGVEKRFMGPLFLGLETTVNSKMDFKNVNLLVSWEF